MKIFSKESGFPYGLKNVYKTEFFDEYYNERICNFKSNDIFDTKKMERIFNNIETKCIGKNVWALFGGNGKNEWICLQVASSKKNIAKEIISDIKCMYPLNNQCHLVRHNSNYFQWFSFMENHYFLVTIHAAYN